MKYLKGNFAVFMEPDPCQGSGYWNFIEMEKEKNQPPLAVPILVEYQFTLKKI